MKIISHRGNIIGPKKERENSPSYIDTAISAGYEVEIDIQYINDRFFLGHDNPDYEVSEKWLISRIESLWIHCKNIKAASKISTLSNNFKFFCHTSDDYVLTSTKHIWVHNLKMNLDVNCIIPLISDTDIIEYNNVVVYAICTDYPSFGKFNLKQKGLFNE